MSGLVGEVEGAQVSRGSTGEGRAVGGSGRRFFKFYLNFFLIFLVILLRRKVHYNDHTVTVQLYLNSLKKNSINKALSYIYPF